MRLDRTPNRRWHSSVWSSGCCSPSTAWPPCSGSSADTWAPGGPPSFGAWPSWWAALIQLVCGLLVLTGLFTRIAALLASGSMAYAYFVVHQPQDLLPLRNGGELAALFCWAFFLIAVLGPGSWALDRLRAGQPGLALGKSRAPSESVHS